MKSALVRAAAQWPFMGREDEIAQVRVALDDSNCRGLILAGSAGLGKSRIAQHGLAMAKALGFITAHAIGTSSARSIPFGALAHLLSQSEGSPPEGSPPQDRGQLMTQAAAAILDLAGSRRLVLLVDDVHLLDGASAALLYHLTQTDQVFLLLTIRGGETAPDAVVALWKEDLIKRIEVPGLPDAVMRDLVSDALGGAVAPSTMTSLLHRSDQNVLFMRELVLGAVADGSLLRNADEWSMQDRLRPSNRLIELVEDRFQLATASERELLELIAVAEPLDLDEVRSSSSIDLAVELERRGLIRCEAIAGRTAVWMAHPIYGDVVREHMPRLRTAQIAERLAQRLEARPIPTPEELLRIGRWRLLSGNGDPTVLLAAARAARWAYDFAFAEELARAAQLAGAGFDARLLGIELAALQGHGQGAWDELRLERARTSDPAEQFALIVRQLDLGVHLSRWEDGLALATEAISGSMRPDWRVEISARAAAFVSGVQGPRATTAVVVPLLSQAVGAALVWACLCGAWSHSRQGDLETATALTNLGYDTQISLAEPLTFYPWFHLGTRIQCLLHSGALAEAESMSRAQRDLAIRDRSPEAQAYFSLHLAHVLAVRGRPSSSGRYATEAADMFAELGRPMFVREALCCLALALSRTDCADTAEQALTRLDAVKCRGTVYEPVEVLQARAALALARGQIDRARTFLRAAAELGERVGDNLGAIEALHELAKLGRASEVRENLQRLGGAVSGDLAGCRVRAASALATGESLQLERVAQRMEDLGADLLAADSFAHAAALWQEQQQSRRATAAANRARSIADRCEGAATPALRRLGSRRSLTSAEWDTAILAAAGLSNKQIATEQSLSVRTVENRLQRIYSKLGVAGRTDLADVCGGTVTR